MNSQARYVSTLLLVAAAFFMLYALMARSESSRAEGVTSMNPQKADDISGAAEFQRYCALCHGLDGRGVGPLTDADRLKAAPADLTQIAKRGDGVFPFEKTAAAIQQGGSISGHKGTLMLPWVKIFSADGDPARAEAMVVEITKYLESIQEK